MLKEVTDNKMIITCPKCGKTLLHAKSGDFQIKCSNPKCLSMWNITVEKGRLDFDIVEQSHAS